MAMETTLENYDCELVRCIHVLKSKRDEVHQQILREEEDRVKIQRELKILNERLQRLNDSLVMKTQARTEYDKTIAETEAAYSKILESAQTLVHVLKRESTLLDKKTSLPVDRYASPRSRDGNTARLTRERQDSLEGLHPAMLR